MGSSGFVASSMHNATKFTAHGLGFLRMHPLGNGNGTYRHRKDFLTVKAQDVKGKISNVRTKIPAGVLGIKNNSSPDEVTEHKREFRRMLVQKMVGTAVAVSRKALPLDAIPISSSLYSQIALPMHLLKRVLGTIHI